MLTKCEKQAPVKVEPVNKNRFFDSAILSLWCLNHLNFDLYIQAVIQRNYRWSQGLLELYIFIIWSQWFSVLIFISFLMISVFFHNVIVA